MAFQHALGAHPLLISHAKEIAQVSRMLHTKVVLLQRIDQLYRWILAQLGIHPSFLLLSDRLNDLAIFYVLGYFSHRLVCSAKVSPANEALNRFNLLEALLVAVLAESMATEQHKRFPLDQIVALFAYSTL